MTGSATLNNPNDLQVGGVFNWADGIISGSGSTTVAGGMNLTSDTVSLWANHHLTISGGVATAGDRLISMSGGSVITIGAGVTYTYSGDFRLFDGGLTTTIDVDGTLVRDSGTSNPGIQSFIDNSGLIHNKVGTLVLTYGGVHSGDLLGDPGTVLDIRGGQEFLPSSSLIGDNVDFALGTICVIRGAVDIAGDLFVNGGDWTFTDETTVTSYGTNVFVRSGHLRFESPVTAPSLDLDSVTVGETGLSGASSLYLETGQPISIDTLNVVKGSIYGSDAFTINSSFTWNDGGFYSGGAITNNGDATVLYTSGVRYYYRDIVNAGTFTFQVGGIAPSNADFTNLPAATIDIRTTGGAFSLSTNSTVYNEGLLIKTDGDGVSAIQCHFRNSGVVEVQIGTLEFYGSYSLTHVQTDGQTILNGGDINVTSPGVYEIQGGELTGAGTVTGEVDNSGGTVRPGLSAGTIFVDGDYSQGASAKLAIEIGGTTQGVDFDSLEVSGTATLAGELTVELIGGYVPVAGEAFEVLTGGSLSGTFDTVTLPGLPSDLNMVVTYPGNSVVLEVVALIPGDCDDDGDVDLLDFACFVDCFTGPGGGILPGCEGLDFDDDGDVDLLDYGVFQQLVSQ